MPKTLILDSGAHSIKVGLNTDGKPAIYPNCIFRPKGTTRLLVSDEIISHRDQSSLFYLYPHQNGYLLNWDVQRTIWDYLFHDKV